MDRFWGVLARVCHLLHSACSTLLVELTRSEPDASCFFVSKMHSVTGHEDRPSWMGHIDFSGLKLKLISSIVAISAIHLLRTFLNVSQLEKADVGWQLAIHLGFVVSGVLLAWMDRLSGSTPADSVRK
ncbi:MAG: YqhA family protein [Bradyrhizobium sp.]